MNKSENKGYLGRFFHFFSMICAIIFTEEKKENLFGMGSTYIYRVFNPYQRESTYHLPNSLICVKGETFTFKNIVTDGLEVKFYDSMGKNINLPEIWGTSASISFNDEKLDFGENE
ncbi:hypothetical protein TURU_080234 [Turdus rufiventris]|nr:hypothetical protein TURU_080234 [Turdus rufiventris]